MTRLVTRAERAADRRAQPAERAHQLAAELLDVDAALDQAEPVAPSASRRLTWSVTTSRSASAWPASSVPA